MDTFYKVTMHALELLLSMGAAWMLLSFFGLADAEKAFVATIAINALAKFVRSSENVPIDDYVND